MIQSNRLSDLRLWLCPWRESSFKGPTNSLLIAFRAKESRICVPVVAVGQREKARVSGLHPQRWERGEKRKAKSPGLESGVR